MTRARRSCAALLALLGAAYVAAFVPANLTGTANVNMLSVFKLDEFAQYRALWRMTEPAPSALASVRQFVAYDYYSYGFPFFALSGLTFLPLRHAYVDTGAPGLTSASMLVLRELSAVLDVLSILILVWLWTDFRSIPRAVALFVFLAALPTIVADSLWWHPDAVSTLFVVATIAALVRDRLRLGRWFYAAAVAAGLATATKLFGLWFFAAVALHLARALPGRTTREMVAHGAGFAAAMALATLIASPMLFVPGEWAKVAAIQGPMQSVIAFGWGEKSTPGLAAWLPTLHYFGGALALLPLLGVAVATAVYDRERRDLSLTILAYALPLSAYVISVVAYQNERYLMPALLPLASCAGSEVWLRPIRDRAAPVFARLAGAAVALALCASLVQFAAIDRWRYREQLDREGDSASLAFYRDLERDVLAQVPADTGVRILLTPYVYVPPDPRFDVRLRWGGLEPADLTDADPDLVLVRREDLVRFSDPTFSERSSDAERARRQFAFYDAAARDALPGYRQLLATDYALAFGRVAN
jgi:hypothetical protein